METLTTYHVKQLYFPIGNYKYIVEIWRSIDNGKTYAFYGNAKYFQTKKEALCYIEKNKSNT